MTIHTEVLSKYLPKGYLLLESEELAGYTLLNYNNVGETRKLNISYRDATSCDSLIMLLVNKINELKTMELK